MQALATHISLLGLSAFLTMAQQWERVSELFEAALDLPTAARDAWLTEMCDGDAALRREVEEMLAASERSHGILEQSNLLRPLAEDDGPPSASFGDTHPTMPMKRQPVVAVDEQIGPYRLIREIGQGGMGVVYKAHDPRLDRHIALKFLPEPLQDHPALEKRFKAEAKAASALHHPNICTIYDIGETDDGLRYIAMAYYEGETLARRLNRGPLEIKEALSLAIQICNGLNASHEAGITHRDIKPSNIMVTEGNDEASRATILDFGVAKLEGSTRATAPGTLVGTVSYMSPERLLGGETDHRGDLWSFGVMLYEMLTGTRPFRGDHPIAVLQGILHREPPSVHNERPDVPQALAAIVRKTLLKTQEDRYQSAAELVTDLTALREALSQAEGTTLPVPEVRTAPDLPPKLTSFLGRERELPEALALLHEHRLLTLVGAGGTGKTRLAIELARAAAPDFADGVLFVELAPIREPALVAPAIARHLGLAETAARDTLEMVQEALHGRHLLLVLDNFEQVMAAAPVVSTLLNAPRLKIVVTSRVILRLTGEQSYPVPPLALPNVGDSTTTVSRSAASALFVERAKAACPTFELTDKNAAVVSEICSRLDGLPLAIELAAARVRLFNPEALLARLGQRLDLLKTAARDQPERHRTLRHAVAWSYDLLSEDEQTFFRRMTVFSGGASLEAAEVVVEAGNTVGDEVAAPLDLDILDGIEALLDQSLLQQQDTPTGEPRFRVLETMREFGQEALRETGEWDAVCQAHAKFYLELAEEAAPNLTGPDLGVWLGRLEVEHDNLRAAVSWAVEKGEADVALRLTVALWRFWVSTGFMNEGRRRLESALALPGAEPQAKASALHALGTVTYELGQTATARPLLSEALEIWRQLDDHQGMATILTSLGWLAVEHNDHGDARRLSDEGFELHSRNGDQRGMALALNNLGWIALYEGDTEKAEETLERSLELRREANDRRGVAFGLTNLSRVAVQQGRFDRAQELLAEALEIAGDVQDRLVYHWALTSQGIAALESGDLGRALTILEPLQNVWRELGHRSALAFTLTGLAQILVRLEEPKRAERLLGEALTTWEGIGNRWGVATIQLVQAELRRHQGDRTAAALARQSLALRAQIDDRRGQAECCEMLALLLASQEAERAARLLGAAEALRSEAGAPLPPFKQEDIDGLQARLAESLGETGRDTARDEGRELPRLRFSQELMG